MADGDPQGSNMYDLMWSRRILAEFTFRHGRGVDLFQEVYELPVDYALDLLRNDPRRWCAWKALIKHLEDCVVLYRQNYEASPDAGSNYYTFVKYLRRVLERRSFPAELDLLDTEVLEDPPSEGAKQRVGGEFPSSRRQLSLPFGEGVNE